MADEFDPFVNVPAFTGIPTDEDVTGLLGKSAALEQAHTAALASDQTLLDAKWQELSAESEKLVGQLGGAGAIAGVTGAARKVATDKLSEYRKEVVATSEANRSDQLRQLAEANAKAEAVLRVYPGPLQMLGVCGLGDEKRTHYAAQLATAGHSQLQTMARYALAKGDFALAAAVADRVAALPKESRPFTAMQIAGAMVGQRHAALVRAAKQITNTYQRVINAEREHVSGRRNSRARLANAVRELASNKSK